MKFLSAFAFGASLLSTVSGRPTEDAQLEKRATKTGGTFAITGVHSGGVQPRLEIRTLQQNADQWNLFLLSLSNFQAQSQSNNLSFYSIAAIHGLPIQAWDGVQGNPTAMNEGAVGYCTHSSILFPTWHRVYVALFEQLFYTTVQSTVASFPSADQSRWQAAATNLRWPYWDWASDPPSGQNNIPSSITNPTVTITGPSGQVTINNPLYSYKFNPLDSNGFIFSPWNQFPETLRYPTTEDSSAVNQDSAVIQTMNGNHLSYQQRVYNLFTAYSNYSEFSNEGWITNGGTQDSLESVHDAIHGDLGGYNDGHMGWLYWAAFDPVFFLHHANVDRLTAMWQTVHPTSYVVPYVSSGNSYYYPTNSTQGPLSPLAPFHKNTKGAFWTSRGVRDWTVLGYTYPEFLNGGGTASNMMATINNLYGPSAQQSAKKRDIPSDQTVSSVPTANITTPDGNYYQYIANIVASRMALNGTYSIFMFLGTPPASSADWPAAPNMIGSHSIFSAPFLSSQMPAGQMLVSGSIPLTDALINQIACGNLTSLDPTVAVPFLQKSLTWRVVRRTGQVNAGSVRHLEVSVVSAETTQPASNNEFPVWSNYLLHPIATSGKPAGRTVEDSR